MGKNEVKLQAKAEVQMQNGTSYLQL